MDIRNPIWNLDLGIGNSILSQRLSATHALALSEFVLSQPPISQTLSREPILVKSTTTSHHLQHLLQHGTSRRSASQPLVHCPTIGQTLTLRRYHDRIKLRESPLHSPLENQRQRRSWRLKTCSNARPQFEHSVYRCQ